jgi:hypothetical protein
MKTKIVTYHEKSCRIHREMLKRGYRSESKYWFDVFRNNEKPVKYKLIYISQKGRRKEKPKYL